MFDLLSPFSFSDYKDNAYKRALNDLRLGDDMLNFKSIPTELNITAKEFDDHYLLDVNVAGINKEDLAVDYQDDKYLIIQAERKEVNNQADKDGNIIYDERSYGTLRRKFLLEGIDRDKITAKYLDGVLSINLPKKEQVKNQDSTITID